MPHAPCQILGKVRGGSQGRGKHSESEVKWRICLLLEGLRTLNRIQGFICIHIDIYLSIYG